MNSRYRLAPELRLDARGALWLAKEEMLVVADLHLGYAWAQRERGLLLPVGAEDDTLERLLALQAEYAPREVVLLGDIVHRATPLPAVLKQLCEVVSCLASKSLLTLVTGNHDRGLDRQDLHPARLAAAVTAGSNLLVHGDGPTSPNPDGLRIVMGHEHPAVCLGDGVATQVKCPCFLVSETVLILPAFSSWAAGTVFGSHPFMSPLAQRATFTQAVAICAGKLLPITLDTRSP